MISALITAAALVSGPASDYTSNKPILCKEMFANSQLVSRKLVQNRWAIPWFSETLPGIHSTTTIPKVEMTKDDLSAILQLPTTLSEERIKAVVQLENPPVWADTKTLYRLARNYAGTVKSIPEHLRLHFFNLAEYRFAILRALFARISELAYWSALDYAYHDGSSTHFVFRGVGTPTVIVVNGGTGEIIVGSHRALRFALLPDESFFRNPSDKSRPLEREVRVKFITGDH